MSLTNDASADNPSSAPEVTIVDANQASEWIDRRELWRYRELIWTFAGRDIKVRYRQTLVGIAWTVLQPLAQMLAFNGLFQMLGSKPVKGNVPYAVSAFCGLLLYQLFAGILAASTQCLVDNRHMVTKVYFPRIVLPLSACLRPLLDFSVGTIVFAGLMFWFRVVPHWGLLLAPVVVLLTVVTGLAFGLWLSALNAHYRDFGYIVPFLLQLGMLVSPVVYDSSIVPSRWQWLYHVNPMAALLDGFRWTVLGTSLPTPMGSLISSLSLLFVLISGAWYFRRVDRFLADSI